MGLIKEPFRSYLFDIISNINDSYYIKRLTLVANSSLSMRYHNNMHNLYMPFKVNSESIPSTYSLQYYENDTFDYRSIDNTDHFDLLVSRT